MNDAVLTLGWFVVLGGGLSFIVLLRRLGVSRTHARDLLHVGAGIWCLGWPWWSGPAVPIAFTSCAALAIIAVPPLARRFPSLHRVEQAISGGEERWTGIVFYTWSFAVFTAVGLVSGPAWTAAAALLALAIGDGVGGAAGLRFGRIRYRLPWSKPKSLEGTLVVALGAAVGIAIAATWFGHPVSLRACAAAATVAGIVEAASPRASDNLLLPAAVWVVLMLFG